MGWQGFDGLQGLPLLQPFFSISLQLECLNPNPQDTWTDASPAGRHKCCGQCLLAWIQWSRATTSDAPGFAVGAPDLGRQGNWVIAASMYRK